MMAMTQTAPAPDLLQLPWSLRLLRRLPLPRKLGLLERLFGARLAEVGVAWVSCANGLVWKLDLSESSQRWCVFGDYEGAIQMNWIRAWLSGGGDVVDSGASIGQMLMYFTLVPGVTVHAFEPTQASAEWLAECVQRAALMSVRQVRAGLSDCSGDREILSYGSKSTMHLDYYVNRKLARETIRTLRLDDYLAEQRVERVRLWKLDVETHEPEALAGAADSLAARRIDAILIEVSSGTFATVKSQLASAGYGLHRIEAGGLARVESLPRPGTFNLLALPVRGH